jgi:protein SCO1
MELPSQLEDLKDSTERMKRALLLIFLISPGFVCAADAPVRDSQLSKIPEEVKAATIQEKLGEQVDAAGITLTDETGKSVQLAQYFKPGRPVILTLIYYGCPTLCGYFVTGFTDSLKSLDWTPGQRFEVVTVSIDHREDHRLAADKKKSVLENYGRPEAAAGWHFLTGDEKTIRKLADQVGFGFRYDEKEKQYAHSAAAIVLTPDAKVSRYLYGISFPEKNVRLAVLEASDGKVGSFIEKALLFCYRYDPHSRGYSLAVMKIMKTGSAGTVLAVAGYLVVFWRRQRRDAKPRSSEEV